MLEPEAVALDCVGELASVRGIIQFGTSADHQIALETDARGRGKSGEEALSEIVDWLAMATRGQAAPSPLTRH